MTHEEYKQTTKYLAHWVINKDCGSRRKLRLTVVNSKTNKIEDQVEVGFTHKHGLLTTHPLDLGQPARGIAQTAFNNGHDVWLRFV